MTTETKTKTTTPPDELKYWTAFHRIPGIGRVRYQALLGRFGSLADAWLAGPTDLRSAGLDDRMVDADEEQGATDGCDHERLSNNMVSI